MPRAKTKPVPAAVTTSNPTTELRYTPADMEKLDQFAIGTMRTDLTVDPDHPHYRAQVVAAYSRAAVILAVSKEVASLTK